MPRVKISELDNLGAAPASGDMIPIVDISDTSESAAGTTKRVTFADLGVTGGIGYYDIIDHGGTAGTVRTAAFATDGTQPILWRGTVEPTNAVNGDDWLDYSA